jgi:hypothetical protein
MSNMTVIGSKYDVTLYKTSFEGQSLILRLRALAAYSNGQHNPCPTTCSAVISCLATYLAVMSAMLLSRAKLRLNTERVELFAMNDTPFMLLANPPRMRKYCTHACGKREKRLKNLFAMSYKRDINAITERCTKAVPFHRTWCMPQGFGEAVNEAY